jgi:hypothetical protein
MTSALIPIKAIAISMTVRMETPVAELRVLSSRTSTHGIRRRRGTSFLAEGAESSQRTQRASFLGD